jgi:hypothetical protein
MAATYSIFMTNADHDPPAHPYDMHCSLISHALFRKFPWKKKDKFCPDWKMNKSIDDIKRAEQRVIY